MIALVNKDLFRYEIHALLKAFFPREEVKVRLEGEPLKGNRAQALQEAALDPFLYVRYEENEAVMEVRSDAGSFKRVCRNDLLPEAWRVPEGLPMNEKSPELRSMVKHVLYDLLKEVTGRELPWGELIGIRPTKIARDLIAAGGAPSAAAAYMEETYSVSGEKALLASEIAEREHRMLSQLHGRDGYSIYIGIPFCPTTCLYCSFPSFALHAWKEETDRYLDALEAEMQAAVRLPYLQGKYLDTVYIGGGTPTTLEAPQLARLFGMIRKYFPMETCLEFTVEAGRADSITAEKLRVIREAGVTRISINPQTMQDETLRLIGRRHTSAQVEEAFAMAREEGFDNINMDIILGLPGEDSSDVRYTTERIRQLGPDSLTVHTLAIKRGSRLQKWIEENGYESLKDTEAGMEAAAQAAAQMGMLPYYLYRQKNMTGNLENTGYAVPGKFGIYNILIMEEVQSILALGAGSISKVLHGGGRIERADNCKDVRTYLETLPEMIRRKEVLFRADEA